MYMYQELKKLLEGGRDFTPNAIKTIIIHRGYLLFGYHTRMPRLVQLNIEESTKDISKNGTTGALHNILKQRQLSCLEEIYVDSVFMNYQNSLNLQAYVDSLVNSASRLRFYGYTDAQDVSELLNLLSNAKAHGLHDYTLAMDKNRKSAIQFVSTDNKDWFKKYNLRPSEYPSDGEKGTLARWLKMVENAELVKSQKTQEASEYEQKVKIYGEMIKKDIDSSRWWNLLCGMKTYGMKSRIGEKFTDVIEPSGLRVVNKIEKSFLKAALNSEGISPDNEDARRYISLLNRIGAVVDDGSITIPLKELSRKLETGESLLGYKECFLKLANTLEKANKTKDVSLLTALNKHEAGLPSTSEGVFIRCAKEGNYETLTKMIILISGYTIERLKQDIQKGQEKRRGK